MVIKILLSMYLVPQCPSFEHLVKNGAVSYSQQQTVLQISYSVGTIATITCDPGFVGGGFVTCGSSGVWSSTPPSCEGSYPVLIGSVTYH